MDILIDAWSPAAAEEVNQKSVPTTPTSVQEFALSTRHGYSLEEPCGAGLAHTLFESLPEVQTMADPVPGETTQAWKGSRTTGYVMVVVALLCLVMNNSGAPGSKWLNLSFGALGMLGVANIAQASNPHFYAGNRWLFWILMAGILQFPLVHIGGRWFQGGYTTEDTWLAVLLCVFAAVGVLAFLFRRIRAHRGKCRR